jgi:hypothetical protein
MSKNFFSNNLSRPILDLKDIVQLNLIPVIFFTLYCQGKEMNKLLNKYTIL